MATEINAALWPSLTLPELLDQQTLLLDRVENLQSLRGYGTTPAIESIMFAVTKALEDIDRLIQHARSQTKF